jgi:hypothetical protein
VLIAADGLNRNYTGAAALTMNGPSPLMAVGRTANLDAAGISFLGTRSNANCTNANWATVLFQA